MAVDSDIHILPPQHSAQTALEENERIFTELLLSIERKYNEVKEMIRSHEKTTVTRGEILLNRMEEEITLLRKKHNDLEKLSHTDDHIHFLQVVCNTSDGETSQLCLPSNPRCSDHPPGLAVSVRPLGIRRPQQYQCGTVLLF